MSYRGLLTRCDRSTEQQPNITVWPDNPMGWGSDGITERFQWTFPIIFSPIDKPTIFTSSQHLWKTTSGGQRWERISPDLTRHDPKTMGASGGPVTKDNTGSRGVAPSPPGAVLRRPLRRCRPASGSRSRPWPMA